MNNVSAFSRDERAELFRETSVKVGIPEAIIEKDFWVCWVLNYLFNKSELSKDIIFKGGTSLSKVFGIIERFSEDIDLVLNWKLLGVTGSEPWIVRSKTKQNKYNKTINIKAQEYISTIFIDNLKSDIINTKIKNLDVKIDEEDPFVVNVHYPKAFQTPYIRPVVRLEIGPLASWVPHQTFEITPYCAVYFPEIFSNPKCKVISINAEMTFWEKVTILHQEAHRPQDKKIPWRFSRHYYDLYKMNSSPIKNSSFAVLDLLTDVVKFKMQFYSCNWANYDLAVPGTIKLIPPVHNLNRLKDDYSYMKEMIFGEKPDFSEILSALEKLENEINRKL